MDEQQLKQIRDAVQRQAELESDDTEVFSLPEYEQLDRQLAAQVPALLDCIEAMRENIKTAARSAWLLDNRSVERLRDLITDLADRHAGGLTVGKPEV